MKSHRPRNQSSCTRPRDRRAVTVLELLIVILILLMVTAAAIPLMAPALENRRMREAARLASTFLSGARARAIQTGRPVGVSIVRSNGMPYATSLAYMEVPPPYGGETTNASCQISLQGAPATADSLNNVPASASYVQWFRIDTTTGDMNPLLLRVGDQLQIGNKGHVFTILGPDYDTNYMPAVRDGVIDQPSTATLTLDVAYLSTNPSPNVVFPWSGTPSSPQPFHVVRQPVRSSDPPMELPEGVVIDLMYSGVGNDIWGDTTIAPANWRTNPPVMVDPLVLFNASGSVESVRDNLGLRRVTGKIYLLLGRRELMADATKSGVDENLSDPYVLTSPLHVEAYRENFWISTVPQTGLVSVIGPSTNSGELFQDDNGNGIPDPGEYMDLNGNMLFDHGNVQAARFISQSASAPN